MFWLGSPGSWFSSWIHAVPLFVPGHVCWPPPYANPFCDHAHVRSWTPAAFIEPEVRPYAWPVEGHRQSTGRLFERPLLGEGHEVHHGRPIGYQVAVLRFSDKSLRRDRGLIFVGLIHPFGVGVGTADHALRPLQVPGWLVSL